MVPHHQIISTFLAFFLGVLVVLQLLVECYLLSILKVSDWALTIPCKVKLRFSLILPIIIRIIFSVPLISDILGQLLLDLGVTKADVRWVVFGHLVMGEADKWRPHRIITASHLLVHHVSHSNVRWLLFPISLELLLWIFPLIDLLLLSSFGWLLLAATIEVLLAWLEGHNDWACATFFFEVLSEANIVLWVVVWRAIGVIQVVLHRGRANLSLRVVVPHCKLLFLSHLVVNCQIVLFLLLYKTFLRPLDVIKVGSLQFQLVSI